MPRVGPQSLTPREQGHARLGEWSPTPGRVRSMKISHRALPAILTREISASALIASVLCSRPGTGYRRSSWWTTRSRLDTEGCRTFSSRAMDDDMRSKRLGHSGALSWTGGRDPDFRISPRDHLRSVL